MQNLAEISPVLGVYDGGPRAFGNLLNARYAAPMTGIGSDWTIERRGDSAVLKPSGRIDESTADAFKDFLLGAVSDGPTNAVIDLGGIDYMSSRGLRALTLAQRASQESGTTIVLAHPNDTMREILAISRYDMVFRVADSVEEALGH